MHYLPAHISMCVLPRLLAFVLLSYVPVALPTYLLTEDGTLSAQWRANDSPSGGPRTANALWGFHTLSISQYQKAVVMLLILN